jgi:putative membrane protein
MSFEHDPRVYFAAERTMLAWVRTGLAMMGFGFVVARFDVASLWAGTLLVVLGVVVNAYAAVAHTKFSARFQQGDSTAQTSRFGVIVASALAALGTAMAVYLIVQAS